ncbi:hypothetical protein NMG60_11030296 [Bertholletia excelsa]
MGLHLVALAKLHLATAAAQGGCPVLASLVWPFVLKLSCSISPVRRDYVNVLYAWRLFFFRLSQIVLNAEPGLGDRTRWHRALRLVCEWFNQARRAPAGLESDPESFRAFSMLSL